MTLSKAEVEAANTMAVSKMMKSDPVWVDVGSARERIGIKGHTLLHAGPPISWERASGPLRGAVVGAILYEGWAERPEKAKRLAAEGGVKLECTHQRRAVGPMAGVISPSMPVYVVKDKVYGSEVYSNMNEGLGSVLRYGAYSAGVVKRLRWMSDFLAPILRAAVNEMVKQVGGLSVKQLLAQALTMGDECHNRYIATTSLFIRQLAPFMVKTGFSRDIVAEALRFMNDNSFMTLNIGMAASKAMTLAAHNTKRSTIVTAMSRNGSEAGIWVSGLGERWFTARAPVPSGVLFPGFKQSDANPDIGDSAITETAGLGGFAMAAAPAIVSWVGGSVRDALDVTNKMYEITYAKHKHFQIPFLDFQGTPVGIDVRKVLKTGITPILNTGIAHRKAGVGQIGAGTVEFPLQVFEKSFKAMLDSYGA